MVFVENKVLNYLALCGVVVVHCKKPAIVHGICAENDPLCKDVFVKAVRELRCTVVFVITHILKISVIRG